MSSIAQKIRDYVINNDIIEKGDRIVVGVSGGADSVCLLHWLNSVKEDFGLSIHAVHIHHGIRGGEADEDMRFTESICASLGVPCDVRKYNVPEYAKEHNMTVEEAGRLLRYQAFEEVRQECGYDRTAVAHHQDDSVETILFNLVRGTGAKGLRGIAPVSENVVRPLLSLSRVEIEEYLRENNISWRNDSSNRDEEYSRNKIRNTVIPALKEINERAVGHILESSVIIGDMYRYVLSEANKCFFDIAQVSEGEVILPVKEMLAEEQVIRREVIRLAIDSLVHTLKDITAKHIYSIELMLFGQSGRFQMLPYGVMVVREQAGLKLYREDASVKEKTEDKTQETEVEVNCAGVYELPFGQGCFFAEPLPENTEVFDENTLKNMENMYTKRMDCDKIKGTLLLRTRRSGDYLIVNSGQSHKKLKEYFIEQKIPVTQRDKVLLLADGSHVLWVLGYRMSDGCKITAETTRQIEFRWIKDFAEEQ